MWMDVYVWENHQSRMERYQGETWLRESSSLTTTMNDPQVKISQPSSVTTIVCSYWAERFPSEEIKVHSSGRSTESMHPSTKTGSIVKAIPGWRMQLLSFSV
eukprot:Sdes_comp9721_c0_seq1m1221